MGKRIVTVLMCVLLFTLVPFASSGFNDTWSRITGWVTSSPVSQNITVTSGSAPVIYDVWNESMTDLSSGPTEDSPTYTIINFSVSDSEGYGNINSSSGFINISSGSESRTASCTEYETGGIYANYTCNVTVWWFDTTGTWNIDATISDNNANSAQNNTDTFYIGSTAGFESSPSSLAWSNIAPGATGVEPSNHILMNNTGNIIRNIEVNATDLIGETNSAQALWAANFSAHTAAGCGGIGMVSDTYTDITGASLPVGNYTIGDGTGQEEIYVCLEAANSVLDAQAYSTAASGSWTVKIVA